MMYVKPVVRKGLLGRMLVELLDTRVMVKQAMKRLQNDRVTAGLQNVETYNDDHCSLGDEENLGCKAIGIEIHSERHVRLY